MADSAIVEHVDMNIGGDGGGAAALDWSDMTTEQKRAAFVESAADHATDETVDQTNVANGGAANATTEQAADSDETSAADDAAPVPETVVEGEGEEDGAGEAEWLDQDTLDFAAMMGLSDEDLAEFGSREELDRALRIIDRKAFEAGKAQQKTPVKPAEKSAEKPAEQLSEKPADKAATIGDPLAELDSFKLDEELGAEDAPKIAKAFAAVATELKELRAWRDATQQQSQQQATAAIRRQALDSIHSLGNTELFGKPGERPTKEQAANIEKAIDAHFVHARGLFAAGRQAAPTPAFLRAAVNLAFGDQLSKQAKQQVVAKIREQSKKRTGGPGAKHIPKEPPDNETSEQFKQRMAADPDLVASARRHGIRVS